MTNNQVGAYNYLFTCVQCQTLAVILSYEDVDLDEKKGKLSALILLNIL